MTIYLILRNIAVAVAGTTLVRSALALPMLSALLVTLSGQPSPAQTSNAFAPAGKPGEAQVMAGTEATVLSSVHYQARRVLSCGGSPLCSGSFPAVGAKRRLNVTRMNCFIQGTAGSTFSAGAVEMMDASNLFLMDEYLPGAYSAPNGFHTLNHAIDMEVIATRHIKVSLVLSAGATASAGVCTATGTLDTLQ
jgi:hypothetical protein